MIAPGFLAPGWEGAPINELGERCDWPFDPLLIVANGPVPLGQYHCPVCGGMVIAGVPHLDWSAEDIQRGHRVLEEGAGDDATAR